MEFSSLYTGKNRKVAVGAVVERNHMNWRCSSGISSFRVWHSQVQLKQGTVTGLHSSTEWLS